MIITTCEVKEYVHVDRLRLHPENPRKIEKDRFEDLKRSIVEKGFYEPILVWGKDNIVLSGNHRLKAAQALIKDGYEFKTPLGKNQLPVVYEDCDEDTAKAILFESNNHYAEWIEEKLREAVKDAEEIANGFGFTTKEIDTMIREASEKIEPVDINDFLEEEKDVLFVPPELEGDLRSLLEAHAPKHWEVVISLLGKQTKIRKK